MSCERYEDGLIEHALGAPPSADVAAHLSSCAACRARLDAERRLAADIDGLLTTALRVEPRDGFEERVRRHVQAAERRGPRPMRWIALGAGLAAVLAIALLVRLRPHDRNVSMATIAPSLPPPAVAPTAAPTRAVARPRAARPPSIRDVAGHAAAEPEVIVAAEDAAALRRLIAGLHEQQARTTWVQSGEAPLEMNHAAHEFDRSTIGTVAGLPRLQVSDVPLYDARPLTSLTTGGGV